MNGKAFVGRIARMTGQAIVTVGVVVVLVFLLVRIIPGDPVKLILGTAYTPSAAAALRQQLHLDQPLLQQFLIYAGGLLHGDLSESTSQGGRPVTDIIATTLPTTLAVIASGIVIGVVSGVALGLLAALTKRPAIDLAVRTWTILTFAAPTFLIALLLILVFSLDLGWLPAGGWAGRWPDNLRYLVLPGVALSATMATIVTRAVRQGAIDVQQQQFVEAAFMRGLPGRALALRHVLPNSLLPVLTLVGISVGTLLTGAIIVESVFGIPGLGSAMSNAVAQRDYPVVQGITLVAAVVVVLAGYVVEVLYTLIDPRTRTR